MHLDECELVPAALPLRGEPARLRARQAVSEPMPAELKAKLAALRIPLD